MAARHRGRWLAAASLLAPFLVFFAAHPDAWRPFLTDSVWGAVLLAVGRRLPLEPLRLRAISVAYTAWIPLALAAALWVVRRRGATAPAAAVMALLCAGGLAAWLPQLTRPYLHYALLPLPFATLALVYLLVEGRGRGLGLARALLVTLAVLPLTVQGWIGGRLRRGQERRVSAWIARSVAPELWLPPPPREGDAGRLPRLSPYPDWLPAAAR